MTTTLTLQFYPHTELPKTTGLKHVLFKITDAKTSDFIGYDWGYANFEDSKFEVLTAGERIATVYKWSEVPNPQLIV